MQGPERHSLHSQSLAIGMTGHTLKCGTLRNLAGKPRDERHVRGRSELKNTQSLETDKRSIRGLGFNYFTVEKA